jgi:hypothetical protein
MALGFKLIGELMRKNDSGKVIKGICKCEFDKITNCFKEIEGGAHERNNRILTLEIKFSEIISRMTRLEAAVEKNVTITTQVLSHMAKRKGNGDSEQ